MIEHLAFRATAAYENFDIVKFLESIGAPFGPCQNAHTGWDETVYELHVPTDEPGLLGKSLGVLRQWAREVRISDADVAAEKPIVLEEWRQSQQVATRNSVAFLEAVAGADSLYARRLPIGTKETITAVPAELLRAFYRKYYQPHNQAVIVCGDFEPAEALALVRCGTAPPPPPPGGGPPALPPCPLPG